MPPFLNLRSPRPLPTPTLATAVSRVLGVRQSTVTVTTAPNEPSASSSANNSTDLSGGAIAGIVIGSIVGLLILLWILRSCCNLGAPPGERASQPTAWYDDERARRRAPHHHHRHHHRPHSRSSTYSRSPARQPEMVVRESRSGSMRRPSPVYVQQYSDSRRGSRGRY